MTFSDKKQSCFDCSIGSTCLFNDCIIALFLNISLVGNVDSLTHKSKYFDWFHESNDLSFILFRQHLTLLPTYQRSQSLPILKKKHLLEVLTEFENKGRNELKLYLTLLARNYIDRFIIVNTLNAQRTRLGFYTLHMYFIHAHTNKLKEQIIRKILKQLNG